MNAAENAHPCEWCRGYAEQAMWLAGKSPTEAQQALDARRATLETSPYNDGGTAATRDYINGTIAYAILTGNTPEH